MDGDVVSLDPLDGKQAVGHGGESHVSVCAGGVQLYCFCIKFIGLFRIMVHFSFFAACQAQEVIGFPDIAIGIRIDLVTDQAGELGFLHLHRNAPVECFERVRGQVFHDAGQQELSGVLVHVGLDKSSPDGVL